MLIDWFTVVAQTVNFLVLVWLLKRFFYRPILNAIDAREQRIAAALAEADAKKLAGDQEREEFQRKTHELEQPCAAILSQALDEAQAERQRLIAAAHEDAAKWRVKWEETVENGIENAPKAFLSLFTGGNIGKMLVKLD